MKYLYIIVFLFCFQFLFADLYYWTDENGVRHVSSEPPPASTKTYKTLESRPEEDISPKTEQVEEDTSSVPVEDTEGKVIVYTKTHNHVSQYAKAWLNEKNVDYIEYDMETSEVYQKEYEKLGGGRLPLFIIDGKRINGFNKRKLGELLGIEDYE